MTKRIVSILLLAVLLTATVATPVFAIDDPNTAPAINEVQVYTDLLERGDAGVLVSIFLDYDPVPGIPTETVTEAYLVVFVDTDGTTQIKSVAPYTFVDSGYGRNTAWIYFTPDEVTAHGLDRANVALYKIWLTGNPTLDWDADPPKTIADIDDWMVATADASVLLALKVLEYADTLELAWTLDMIEEVVQLGNRLTTGGASYFTNVIANLRTMAPACFSTGTIEPSQERLDFETLFGATMTDVALARVTGSPITFTEGETVVDVTTNGDFIFELEKGTTGTVTDLLGTVTGSPVALVEGINTITTTVIGTLTVDVNLEDTSTIIEDTIIGTGFDLTEVAGRFGMTRWFFSGIVWLIITIAICFGTYRIGTARGGAGSGKVVMLVFNICMICGAVLGLMHPIVAGIIVLGFAGFFLFQLFYKPANI